ncbi:hypothetical protein S83_005578, partial [Arachis hypogaea]
LCTSKRVHGISFHAYNHVNSFVLQRSGSHSGSTNKPKFVKIVGFASCGLFALIILGAISVYRYNHMHRHKTDVFFDVS